MRELSAIELVQRREELLRVQQEATMENSDDERKQRAEQDYARNLGVRHLTPSQSQFSHQVQRAMSGEDVTPRPRWGRDP